MNNYDTWILATDATVQELNWSSVTCSSDGSKIFATVTGGDIYRSTDFGITWSSTNNADLNTLNWSSITSNSDGYSLYATVSEGSIYSSTNLGVTWEPNSNMELSTLVWSSITTNTDGSKVFATVSRGDIYISTDYGVTFNPTNNVSLIGNIWNSITCSSNGKKVAAVAEENYFIYLSTNSGVTWTSTNNGGSFNENDNYFWKGIAINSDGNKLAAVASILSGTGDVYRSDNSGLTWTPTSNVDLNQLHWNCITSSSDGKKLVAGVGGDGGDIYRSTDSGLTWTSSGNQSLSTLKWKSVTMSANGYRTIAVAYNGGIYTYESSPICFLKGSKILCLIDDKESYIPIEQIKKGTLVRTRTEGYIPVDMIGHSKIYNPKHKLNTKNRLYKCSPKNYPELIDDLVITGCHSILVEKMTQEQREKSILLTGDVYVTENRLRLIVCLDPRAEPYTEEGVHDIYHIALENTDYYMNYGIYANGLLVESTSKRMIMEYSGMEIL
jgi:photosystem II stability/assembly factor-like uncharacterized protein